jgi:hypothetical protein
VTHTETAQGPELATLRDRHEGMPLGGVAAPFGCIRSVSMHPVVV